MDHDAHQTFSNVPTRFFPIRDCTIRLIGLNAPDNVFCLSGVHTKATKKTQKYVTLTRDPTFLSRFWQLLDARSRVAEWQTRSPAADKDMAMVMER